MRESDVIEQDVAPEAGSPSDEPTYRDRIGTIDDEGKRRWIYPKKQDGVFFRWRTWLSYFLLAFLFGAPFIKVHGEPLLLFNIIERKFIIFGLAFWPQDFYLFVLAMITGIVFIFLFTAVFGRIFCGWICPQTVFMEMLFRKIEYWIEGSAKEQRALAASPWTPEKIVKRVSKNVIFYAISFLIGNTFLAYIVGIDQLYLIVTDPPSEHIAGLMAMVIFSGVFYFVFAWFREQACVLVCPYGRLQSVLLDRNSIVISYDFVRGEPREKFRKEAARENAGDCVDCRQCVAVCPTGIDIRNGTQLECVNCALCIDACDEVMVKVNKPKGLIRYASYNAIAEGAKKIFTPRVIGYTAVLVVLLTVLTYLLASRNDIQTTVLRAPGTLFEEKAGGMISNLYTVKVVNKTFRDIPIELRLHSPSGRLTVIGSAMVAPTGDLAQTALFIEIPRAALAGVNTPVEIGVYSGGTLMQTIRTTFMGPGK